MKVALTCIECLLAFMEYFASYLWFDNLKDSLMFGWSRNGSFMIELNMFGFLGKCCLYFLIENFKGNDSYIAAILVYFH